MSSLSSICIASIVSATRVAASRALLAMAMENFYFGYWFSHRRAWYPTGALYKRVATRETV